MLTAIQHFTRYRPVVVLNRDGAFRKEIEAAGLQVQVIPGELGIQGFRAASLREKAARIRKIGQQGANIARSARTIGASILHCQHPNEAPSVGMAGILAGLPMVCHLRDQSRSRHPSVLMTVAALSSALVCVSDAVRQDWLSLAPQSLRRALAGKMVTVPNGIDLTWVERAKRKWNRDLARTQLGISEKGLLVSIVGPLYEKKNQLAFLEAAGEDLLALDPNLLIGFFGSQHHDRDYTSRVHRLAASMRGSQRILFGGEMPHDEMPLIYLASDIILVPSRLEGLPRVAIEAQAFSRPIVGTRNTGTEAAVVDGETGILVSKDHLQGFVSAVSDLSDRSRRAAFGRAGQSFVRSKFNAPLATTALEDVYDRCLDAHFPTAPGSASEL